MRFSFTDMNVRRKYEELYVSQNGNEDNANITNLITVDPNVAAPAGFGFGMEFVLPWNPKGDGRLEIIQVLGVAAAQEYSGYHPNATYSIEIVGYTTQ